MLGANTVSLSPFVLNRDQKRACEAFVRFTFCKPNTSGLSLHSFPICTHVKSLCERQSQVHFLKGCHTNTPTSLGAMYKEKKKRRRAVDRPPQGKEKPRAEEQGEAEQALTETQQPRAVVWREASKEKPRHHTTKELHSQCP